MTKLAGLSWVWSCHVGIWFLLNNPAQFARALQTKPRLWALSATEHNPPDVPTAPKHTPGPIPSQISHEDSSVLAGYI